MSAPTSHCPLPNDVRGPLGGFGAGAGAGAGEGAGLGAGGGAGAGAGAGAGVDAAGGVDVGADGVDSPPQLTTNCSEQVNAQTRNTLLMCGVVKVAIRTCNRQSFHDVEHSLVRCDHNQTRGGRSSEICPAGSPSSMV